MAEALRAHVTIAFPFPSSVSQPSVPSGGFRPRQSRSVVAAGPAGHPDRNRTEATFVGRPPSELYRLCWLAWPYRSMLPYQPHPLWG
jgi:hypothetical protein